MHSWFLCNHLNFCLNAPISNVSIHHHSRHTKTNIEWKWKTFGRNRHFCFRKTRGLKPNTELPHAIFFDSTGWLCGCHIFSLQSFHLRLKVTMATDQDRPGRTPNREKTTPFDWEIAGRLRSAKQNSCGSTSPLIHKARGVLSRQKCFRSRNPKQTSNKSKVETHMLPFPTILGWYLQWKPTSISVYLIFIQVLS